MVFKPVICDNCMMWEIRENPTELNQVCVKCRTIQDLLQRLSLLEKELEEMRQQQELEELTHPQFMEVCTPSRQKATTEMEESRNSWVQIGRSREKKKLRQTQPPEIQTSNKFEPLQHLDDQNQHQENERNNIQDPINCAGQTAKRREVMIVGDSILRNTASSVRSLDPLTTTVCCLPGASVKHITENVDRLLERTGDDPVVVVHIGTNNIGRDRPRSLQNKFRELGRKLKDKTKTVVFSGILPAPCKGPYGQLEIQNQNAWLKSWCTQEGFTFLEHWSTFYNKDYLYRWDGLHLNRKGTNLLGERILQEVQKHLN